MILSDMASIIRVTGNVSAGLPRDFREDRPAGDKLKPLVVRFKC